MNLRDIKKDINFLMNDLVPYGKITIIKTNILHD